MTDASHVLCIHGAQSPATDKIKDAFKH